jgi:type I restriction enzyme S subunit
MRQTVVEQTLKPGWKIWRFDQMAENVGERADPTPDDSGCYVGLEHMDTESLRIRRWGTKTDLIGQKLRMRKNDILFARRNGYLKRVSIAPHDGLFSAHGLVLRAKNDIVLHEFLPFFMQSDIFMDRAIQISVGSLSPTINWKTLAAQPFALPPIEEQQKIAGLLQCAESVTESLHQSLDSLAKLKISFASHAFSKGLYGHITTPSQVHYREIPQNWAVKYLRDVFTILDNRRIPLKDSVRNKRKGQIPYFGASGPIDLIDEFIFDEPLLLLAEDGMNLIFRSSPLIYKVTERCWVNNHAHVLRPTDTTDIDFYAEYLEAISYEPFITGTYQKKITKADCERIPVPVPPMSEQKEIASTFAAINRELKDIAARLVNAKDFLKTCRELSVRFGNVH